MQELPSLDGSASPGRGTNGAGGRVVDVAPADRSSLLRRDQAFPFPFDGRTPNGIRLRRARRVFGSFSGIPRLARNRPRPTAPTIS